MRRGTPEAAQVVTCAGERLCPQAQNSVVFGVFEIDHDCAVLEVDVIEFVDECLLADGFSRLRPGMLNGR